MLVRTQSGAVGTIEASKLATGSEDELRLEIHGSLGPCASTPWIPITWMHTMPGQRISQSADVVGGPASIPDSGIPGQEGFRAPSSPWDGCVSIWRVWPTF